MPTVDAAAARAAAADAVAADADAIPHTLPPGPFAASLCQAARALIDLGSVSDVRILQNGGVVTGVVGGRHRVYIKYQMQHRQAGAIAMGECSCGEPNPCVHVAAVAMTAAQLSDPPVTPLHPPENASGRGAPLRQSLRYVLEPGSRGFEVSIWIIQSADGVGSDLAGAHPFVLRVTDGGQNHPRYVDAQDLAILEVLASRQRRPAPPDAAKSADRPSGTGGAESAGGAGFDLLRRILATGRACWRSLQGASLREGGGRDLALAWAALPNGDQRLVCATCATLDLLLELDPPVYVDTASGDCGPLGLPYRVELLRRYWNRPAIPPEQASAVNAALASEPRANGFPRLRELTVLNRAGSRLRPRLILSAGPMATLRFTYDDIAVVDNVIALSNDGAIGGASPRSDASALRGGSAQDGEASALRSLDGDIVHQITRDLAAERDLRAQAYRFLAGTTSPGSAEAWLAFMLTAVPALRDLGWEIIVQREFPYSLVVTDDWYADLKSSGPMRGDDQRSAARRRAGQSRDWFDLRLGVRVDGQAVDLCAALIDYLRGHVAHSPVSGPSGVSVPGAVGTRSFLSGASTIVSGEHLLIRLDDGRYLPMPLTRVQRIVDVLVELCDQEEWHENQALRLPRAQAGRLAELALPSDAPLLHADEAALVDLIDALQGHSRIEPVAAPARFAATLRPYQEEGLAWLQFLRRHGLGGVLADDMGLGKTVQTIAHLLIEKQHGRLRQPSLIVAPVSVLGNWQREIRRFAPELALLTVHGPKRKDSFVAIDSADVVIIGYSLLLIESERLLEREFAFVILDEAQTIKNPQAKVSQVARALRAQHRLCLTGTPMENHLGDLWSLLDFVQPGFLGERSQFQRHYRTPIENGGDDRRAAALARRIRPFLLRRTKDAVARDLPPKSQIIERIDLDERQRDFYDGLRLGQHRRVREAIDRQGLERSRITVLDALLKLRQACCDPRLVNVDAGTAVIPSAKLDWLATTLPELIAEGRRILLFSQFTSMLRLIAATVTDLGIPHSMLTGETRERTDLVAGFQSGGVPLFLLSLKAGGTGLNLTAADTVIHYDPWWNPTVEAQATDRAHRIGQHKPVFVYKLIAQRTIEEKIMELQADKHALVTRLYDAPTPSPPLADTAPSLADAAPSLADAAPSHLSSADLDALFAP